MKIALITVSDEVFNDIAELTLPSMLRYADLWDLEFISLPPEANGRPTSWYKIKRILEVLRSGFDYCLYLDTDAMFVRFDEDIREHLTDNKDLYLCRQYPNKYHSTSYFNSGVMVWRKCAWSIDFLDEIWRQTEFINHHWWEQAAMLKLLGFQSALGQGTDRLDSDAMEHVKELSQDWNSIPILTVAANPIIRHFAMCSNRVRLEAIKREIALQSIFQTLSLEMRQELTHVLDLTVDQARWPNSG